MTPNPIYIKYGNNASSSDDETNLNVHINRLHGNEHFSNGEFHTLQQLNIDSKYYDIEDLDTLTPNSGNNYKFTAMHINIHSLPAKIDQLNILLLRLKQKNINLHFILL